MFPALPKTVSFALAAISGFICDWAFPDKNLWFLAFVSIAGLVVSIARESAAWNFFIGTTWGIAFFLPHIAWAEYAAGGTLPWIALSVSQALFIGFAMWVFTIIRRWERISNNMGFSALAFAFTWVSVEALRMTIPWGGFPWGRLGFSQSDSPLARLAWLGGIPLISAVIAVLGFLIAAAIFAALRVNMWRVGLALSACVALIIVPFTVPLDTQAQSGTLNVAGIQGNVANPGLGAFANRQEVLNNHVAGTHAVAGRDTTQPLDLVVWPENGTDIDPQVDSTASALIDEAAQAVGVPLLLGAQEYPESGGRYNVSLLWQPGVGVIDRYAKQLPVPFGEYIPHRDFFRKLYAGVDLIYTDMIAGQEIAVVDVPVARLERTVPVAPIICFEVGYDDLIGSAVRGGAEVLFVQTNNASFGHTNESTQQLAMSRLRAIETGRSVLHISTVGVSAMYTPNGVEIARSGHFTAEQLVGSLNLRTSLTPAVVVGKWPVYIVSAGTVLMLVAGSVAGIKQRRSRRQMGTSTTSKKPGKK
ncbi:apolipoprotein N-acyltransferase [Timonella sp. A28]|uniref:apolipoprotein N-acyltransferase n=1 Tax=Timonella sp. A28 TaxID=3442640 RepID=UPI003EB8AF3D